MQTKFNVWGRKIFFHFVDFREIFEFPVGAASHKHISISFPSRLSEEIVGFRLQLGGQTCANFDFLEIFLMLLSMLLDEKFHIILVYFQTNQTIVCLQISVQPFNEYAMSTTIACPCGDSTLGLILRRFRK